MSSARLDEPESFAKLDPGDMFRRVNDLPEQIEDAWRIATAVKLPESYRSAHEVVIAGMGGSAIGGSLLESYGAPEIHVPVSVWRSYGLPNYVNQDSLVIAASYSGNTEETLSALEEAQRRGAKLLVLTTGGRAAELAAEWVAPTIRFSYDAQPRATLGYLFTPLLSVFEQLGFLKPQEAHVREAIAIARRVRDTCGGGVPVESNRAKRIAEACKGRTVVVYGADYLAAVARRWKTQVNENAKNWAFYEEFSELDHNAIVGYEHPEDMLPVVRVLVLYGAHLTERIQTRIEVTDQLMDQYRVPHDRVTAEGQGRLAQMISLIALGDYVTYYLALLNGSDPTVIRPIDHLKEALSR